MLNLKYTLFALCSLFLSANSFAQAKTLLRTSIADTLENPKLTSYNKRQIVLLKDSQIKSKFRFLVQSGMHPNEKSGPKFVEWLAAKYEKGESLLNKIEGDIAIDFVPVINPDGNLESSRYNSRGVNLNRNFSVLWGITKENPGEGPLSEPETISLTSLYKRKNYSAAVDVHGYINWIVAPSTPEFIKTNHNLKISDIKYNQYQLWLQALKQKTTQLPNYELKTAGELGDGGAFEDWAFWHNDAFAFCLELESPFRYENNSRFLFDSKEIHAKYDKFLRYEEFIADMFTKAIEIKNKTIEINNEVITINGTQKATETGVH